jgi:predicted dithiol-disulfide oxidoreductase (DUF899 family)
MSYAETMAALNDRRAQINALQGEMRALQSAVEPEVVQDYVLDSWDGPVRLSELFGDKRDLILIHNMGTTCPACTMWADGFNGVYDHLASRAAFVVSSPNTVEVQKQFARSRGWRFPMVSHAETRFAQDMGYRWRGEDPFDASTGGWEPGVSVFRRDGDRILRVSDAELGPMDSFCPVFHLFDLLPEGWEGWRPQYSYAQV